MRKIAGVLLFVSLITIMVMNCQNNQAPSVDGDKLREYAGDLINRSLYKQAIEVYKDYLAQYKVDKKEQANVTYIIADLYFERLNDYESALAYFLKIKHLYPESSLIDETNQKIVACRERMGDTADAKQTLDEAVALDPDAVQKKRPGEVVARIGKREITQGDLDFEMRKLPPSVRNQLTGKEQKLQFLREYVATELLYDTAKRAGFDKDPEVLEGAFQAKKALMVQRLLQDRVADKTEIEANDVELYYQAYKENYAEKDDEGNIVRQKPLDEVQEQVIQDLTRQKYQDAYQGLIEKMILAEDVQFYENRIQ